MRYILRGILTVVFSVLPTLGLAQTDAFQGRWDATLTIEDTIIPFRLDIEKENGALIGALYNGDLKQTTTSVQLENQILTLRFDHYLTRIVATNSNGKLQGRIFGRFGGSKASDGLLFEAAPHKAIASSVSTIPSIDGIWEIPYESVKGEKSWRLIIHQTGAEASAAILRVDGDTGSLTGNFQNNKWVLSHFDGSRPLRLEITSQEDGSLSLSLRGSHGIPQPLSAYRADIAKTKGVPEPADFDHHTSVRNPSEKFVFRFPDINGTIVSNDDPQFRGKVVIVSITGTWCPNCHDETQYLVELYRKYHPRGVEIVALDFEESEQQAGLSRAKAFIQKYGVQYPYLIAGAPSELEEKVPQALNLNTWPATFFIGKDGLVKKVHAGFAAPASGEFYHLLQEDFTHTLDALLAESPATLNAASATEHNK